MNAFIILTICLSFIFHPSHGFKVFQPHSLTVNPDWSAIISCEHTADVKSVKDVRLYAISQSGNSTMLCQKGMENCKNVVLKQDKNLNTWLFIMVNVGPEAMDLKYQCSFTATVDDIDYDKNGTPTTLVPGQKEEVCVSPSPPPHPPDQLTGILIGLLTLMVLYSCVITIFYATLKRSNSDPENSTYVEMRKVPPQRNQLEDIYC